MGVEMQQLKHLCAVAEHGQIAAAARAVYLTQPALSRSIRNLEEALGAQLFERSRRGVSLTAQGQVFLEYAQRIIREVQRAKQNVASVTKLPHGNVALGITANFSSYIVPEVLRDLLLNNHDISILSVGGFYEDLAVKVRTGEIDFAFALLPITHGHPDLIEDPILPVRYRIYASVHHPLARRTDLTLDEVAACTWVMPDHPAIRNFIRYFEQAGLSPPNIAVKTTSLPFLLETMRLCNFLSMMPDHMAEEDVKRGLMVPLDIHDLPKNKQAALIYRADTPCSPAAGIVMDVIRKACGKRTTCDGVPA